MSTFIVSIILDKRKLNMVHVQNATLAGGVAVGAVADLMIGPVGAIAIGTLSGILSVVGYEMITPFLKKLKLHDTCKSILFQLFYLKKNQSLSFFLFKKVV